MSTPRIVLTGSTGGLGSSVLRHLLKSAHPSSIIVSLYNPSNAPSFVSQLGINVRRGDYSDPQSLDLSFAGASVLFLVSYPSIAHKLRVKNHINAIDAAIRVGVKHVFYTSLAFAGGPSCTTSVAAVMQAHLDTEAYLKNSGVQYTIIREGIYSESYPLYLGFFDPSGDDDTVAIPDDGHSGIAWAARDELGEATALLLVSAIQGREPVISCRNTTILFSGSDALSLSQVAEIVSDILRRTIHLKYVDVDAYSTSSAALTRLGPYFAKSWSTTYEAVKRGECAVVDPALEKVLGRRPKSMRIVLESLLKDVRNAKDSIDQYAK